MSRDVEAPSKRRRNLWGWTQKLKTVPAILVLLLVFTGGVGDLAVLQRVPARSPDRSAGRARGGGPRRPPARSRCCLIRPTLSTRISPVRSRTRRRGDFLFPYYDNFTQTIIAPAAKQKVAENDRPPW